MVDVFLYGMCMRRVPKVSLPIYPYVGSIPYPPPT